MTTTPIEVSATRDRELVRSLITGDRWITAHALADLDDGEFPRTRCFVARRGATPIALGMEYSGWAPQPLHLYGDPEGIATILQHGIRPRAAWVPTPIGGNPVLDLTYETEKINPMLRMGLTLSTAITTVTSKHDEESGLTWSQVDDYSIEAGLPD